MRANNHHARLEIEMCANFGRCRVNANTQLDLLFSQRAENISTKFFYWRENAT